MIKKTMGKMESFLSEDYKVCYPCVEASGICGGPLLALVSPFESRVAEPLDYEHPSPFSS